LSTSGERAIVCGPSKGEVVYANRRNHGHGTTAIHLSFSITALTFSCLSRGVILEHGVLRLYSQHRCCAARPARHHRRPLLEPYRRAQTQKQKRRKEQWTGKFASTCKLWFMKGPDRASTGSILQEKLRVHFHVDTRAPFWQFGTQVVGHRQPKAWSGSQNRPKT
jgi:hypothetical protein